MILYKWNESYNGYAWFSGLKEKFLDLSFFFFLHESVVCSIFTLSRTLLKDIAQFICSPVNRYWDYFQFLAIINKIAINIYINTQKKKKNLSKVEEFRVIYLTIFKIIIGTRDFCVQVDLSKSRKRNLWRLKMKNRGFWEELVGKQCTYTRWEWSDPECHVDPQRFIIVDLLSAIPNRSLPFCPLDLTSALLSVSIFVLWCYTSDLYQREAPLMWIMRSA